MIFAAVGTSLDPFDRLLRMLDDLAGSGAIAVPIVAQTGHCRYTPGHIQAIPFLPPAQMEDLLRTAQAIVCHGGAGLLGTCLQLQRKPIVLVRRAAFREIVNDHQLELSEELLRQGRIYLVHDRDSLLGALKQALSAQEPVPESTGGRQLKEAIGSLLRDLADRRRRP